jgi:hypothetical protein
MKAKLRCPECGRVKGHRVMTWRQICRAIGGKDGLLIVVGPIPDVFRCPCGTMFKAARR